MEDQKTTLFIINYVFCVLLYYINVNNIYGSNSTGPSSVEKDSWMYGRTARRDGLINKTTEKKAGYFSHTLHQLGA
jgi:hypothetical protein